MKEIIVFAGPNGSGKSTIIQKQLGNRNLPNLYICPDKMVKNFLYIKDEKLRYVQAMGACKKLRVNSVKQGKSFIFETVFSTKEKLKFLKTAKLEDYFIEIVYVTTKNPSINISRVNQRFKSGGHNVPRGKIVSRYYRSMKLLHDIIKVADSIKVIDNSDSKPIFIFSKYKNDMYLLNKEKRHDEWTSKYITIPLKNDGFSIKDFSVKDTEKYLISNWK